MANAVKASRRRYTRLVRVLLSDQQEEDLRARAAASDLSLSAAVRQLLSAGGTLSQAGGDGTGLACLVAIEQALLMLRDLLPDGGMRSAQAREQAVLAADWRLAELRESLRERT